MVSPAQALCVVKDVCCEVRWNCSGITSTGPMCGEGCML